jgi:hypothetical protein
MRWVAALLAMVAAIVGLGVLVFVATSSGDSLVFDLEPGACFDLGDGADVAVRTVRTVDCADAHEAEVVAAGRLDDDGSVERPPDDELFAVVDARCAASLDARPNLLERFGILPVAADETSWEPYDGAYACVAIPYGGGTTRGSALAERS